MNISMFIQNQLLATKFYMPVAPGELYNTCSALQVAKAIWQGQVEAYYFSTNDTEAALRSGQQALSLARTYGHSSLTITAICLPARLMKDLGELHEVQQLIQQAIKLGTKPGGSLSPEASWPTVLQAEIVREWNQLDAARSLIAEAMLLSKQSGTSSSLIYILLGYAVLLRISLSRKELEVACSAFQEFERLGMRMNQRS